jgi:uncharacterized protein (UPF0548 family)
VIRVRRPSEEAIEARLKVPGQPFSYPEDGATADAARLDAIAGGYDVDRHSFALGSGRDLFERACHALLAWRHFEVGWAELRGAAAPVAVGQVVATLTRVWGLWFLNPCRVVYTESAGPAADQVAFAYGTLPGHVERGEERFSVRRDADTGEVTYEILAFSRPALLLTQAAYPWVRRVQMRFATSSAQALARACRHSPGLPGSSGALGG